MDAGELVQAKTFRDRVGTVTEKGKRRWVYATKPSGRFYKLRTVISYFYVAIFFILPFIKVNGMPFVLLNFIEGKFILFSKIFWPQDFFIFAVGMVTFIVFIALFTVIYGRLFCGWACPQTVFMEFVFRKIEWMIEGSPAQQKKRNENRGSTDFIVRKVVKHVLFFLLSFLIANAFWSYVIGLDELLKIIREPVTEHLVLLAGLLVFTLIFYTVYAYIREIVCTTICPYGRLQGVMFDKDTMQVSYDHKRGEPRGIIRKSYVKTNGDCIDCKKCVQVCPTGIDIRDGVQLDCVGCTACIDACNNVMEKINQPPGLIRYASENEISKGRRFVFNARMKAYSVLLLLLLFFMSGLIITRKSVDSYISRAKGQLYQEMPGNKYSNLYTAKIINKTKAAIPVSLKLENFHGQIQLVGSHNLVLKPEEVNEITFFIILDKRDVKKHNQEVKLGVYGPQEKFQTVSTTFLGPFI
ncbi:MAG: cytochrome c oxidase accessory protein CcoG [Ferruginibacter sp.]